MQTGCSLGKECDNLSPGNCRILTKNKSNKWMNEWRGKKSNNGGGVAIPFDS